MDSEIKAPGKGLPEIRRIALIAPPKMRVGNYTVSEDRGSFWLAAD